MSYETRLSSDFCEVCGGMYRIIDWQAKDGTWHPRCEEDSPLEGELEEEYEAERNEALTDKAIVDGYDLRVVSSDYHESKGGR